MVDEANLARGLALKQAARAAYDVKGDDAIEAGERVLSLVSTDAQKALDENNNQVRAVALKQAAQHMPWDDGRCVCGERWRPKEGFGVQHDGSSDGGYVKQARIAWAAHIRSLDPDAAQELAAHDARRNVLIEKLVSSLRDYMKMASDHELVQFGVYGAAKDAIEEWAALSESQPAPATQGDKLWGRFNCNTHGRRDCPECGPDPAKEDK